MFSISIFTLVTVLASVFFARAQVNPSEPSPGSVYPEGGSCPIVWGGDPNSVDIWKNMDIELMTGDNFDMIHVTTVATGQDGTVDGQFGYTCPRVTLHSAVYFYQFTNNQTSDKTWTTRFAISDPAGATTSPPNATQPETGDNIPWGQGALVNPSEAVDAPGASSAGSTSSVTNVPSSSSIFIASFTTAPFSSTNPVIPVSIQPSLSSQRVATTAVVVSSSTPSTSTTSIGSSGAIALSVTSVMISLIIPVLSLILI